MNTGSYTDEELHRKMKLNGFHRVKFNETVQIVFVMFRQDYESQLCMKSFHITSFELHKNNKMVIQWLSNSDKKITAFFIFKPQFYLWVFR